MASSFFTTKEVTFRWSLRGPGIPVNKVREDLVEHIDLTALSLAFAGIEIPRTMQGKNVLAADYRPRTGRFLRLVIDVMKPSIES